MVSMLPCSLCRMKEATERHFMGLEGPGHKVRLEAVNSIGAAMCDAGHGTSGDMRTWLGTAVEILHRLEDAGWEPPKGDRT